MSPEQAAWSDPAWVDSLGKSYAKGFGKGKGYGGKVTQPADKSERICNCCGLKSHYARECIHWERPSGKGGKTKGQVYEEKRLASKGKGKGKGKSKGKRQDQQLGDGGRRLVGRVGRVGGRGSRLSQGRFQWHSRRRRARLLPWQRDG